MKTGRNDLCPCGSGKKYKHCCLVKQSGAVPGSPPDAQPVRSLESQQHCGVVDQLMDFLERPDNRQDIRDALLEFLADEPYHEIELDWVQQVFHPWYMHFRLGKNDETLAERFLRRHGHSLSPAERRILDAMGRERFRLMEVREVRPSVGLTLKDVHTGEVFEVLERSASQSLVPWDIFLTRLRRFSTHNELDMAVPLAGRAREPLLSVLAEMLEPATPENAEAPLQDLMTFGLANVFSYIVKFNREAAKPPQLYNTDGDELVICTARYSVKDLDAVKDAISSHRSYRNGNDDCFVWLSGRRKIPGGRMDRISLGTVRFDGSGLILETNSKRRLSKGKASLEKVAGEWIKHEADSFEDFDQIQASGRMIDIQDVEPEIPPEIERQFLSQFYEHYYLEQWPNAPIPALNGQTPMAAAADPRSKNRVVELVKGIENSLARDSKADFDITQLWKLLRLER